MTTPELPPRDRRWFEDYRPGAVYSFGEIEVTEDQVVDFGRRFDPQPALHTDREFAADGPFGGLIASGWHTLALMMRLYVDHYLSSVANWVSPGVDEVRWLKPVRPGARLSIRITVLEVRRRISAPDQGAVTSLVEGIDQAGARVASLKVVSFVYVRDGSSRAGAPGRGGTLG